MRFTRHARIQRPRVECPTEHQAGASRKRHIQRTTAPSASIAQKGHNVTTHATRAIRALLIPILVASGLMLAIGAAAASPAHAYISEAYECSKCNEVPGPEHYIYNNTAENLSGTGVCSALWRFVGGKWYESYDCTSSPTTEKRVTICNTFEFLGHGQSRHYYAKYEYHLWGWETNIPNAEGC